MKIYLVKELYDTYTIADEKLYKTLKEAKRHKIEDGEFFVIEEIDTENFEIEEIYSEEDYYDEQREKAKNNFKKIAKTLKGKTVKEIVNFLNKEYYDYEIGDTENWVGIIIYDNENCISIEFECEKFEEEPTEKNILKHKTVRCNLVES